MKPADVERAIRNVLDAGAEDILCSECFDRVSDYVDRELAGAPVEQEMPAVKYHLEHCRVCREEYETLRDLAQLDAESEPGANQ